MRMTIRDAVTQVQQDILRNLNAYISSTQREGEDWFTPLSFHDDAPRVETDRYYMGIYESSPEGEIYTSNGRQTTVDVTLDCILDDERDNSSHPSCYLSAVTEYLRRKTYGVSSLAYTAITMRTDLGAPVNGFAVALRVTTYDYDMDI